ncbi:hypothetical protein ACIPSA_29840 [Streptomyces sp. NPDC086549]|uniref:hypothetical protein n=1 Tax=Streptomyces sp. NPDC086549 TaxID=3365752 RepID=UPI0038000EF4
MADVVDSDELLRRIQRGRDRAVAEERAWQARAENLRATDPEGAREAFVRAWAYEAVSRVLDEIAAPGRHGEEAGVKQVT